MSNPGSSPLNSGGQSDLDVAASPFLVMGILYALSGLLGLGVCLVAGSVDRGILLLLGVTFLSGTALALVGMGFMKRWRFTLLPAALLCALGLFQFPLGTILFGWAAYAMWVRRSHFYPFDKLNKQPEQP